MLEIVDLVDLEEIKIEENKYMYIYYFGDEIALNLNLEFLEKKIVIEDIQPGTIELEYDEMKFILINLIEKLKNFDKNMIQVSCVYINIDTKILDELQEEGIISTYNDFGDMNIYIFF